MTSITGHKLKKNWLVVTTIGLFIGDSVAGICINLIGKQGLAAGFIGGIAGAIIAVMSIGLITPQNVATGKKSPITVILEVVGGVLGWIVGQIISTAIKVGLEPFLGDSTFGAIFSGSLLGGAILGSILATIQWRVLRVVFEDIGINADRESWIFATIGGGILYSFANNIIGVTMLAHGGIFSLFIALSLSALGLCGLLTLGQWFFLCQNFSEATKWIASGIKGWILGGVSGSFLTALVFSMGIPFLVAIQLFRICTFVAFGFVTGNTLLYFRRCSR